MSITLRSRRGAIGTGALAVGLRERIEAQLPATRAQAGRRAARAGRVEWLDVAPGVARAEVRDELTGDGVVARLDLAPLPPGDRSVLLRIAHAHPELPARLVAGQMPDDVARELAEQEISLLPSGAADLSHDCSCHDWPGPCQHVAALAYVLVEAVDADPTTLLTWRGVTLEELAAPSSGHAGTAPERDAASDDGDRDDAGVETADPGGRFDPTRADAALLVAALGLAAARALARFYGAADPAAPDPAGEGPDPSA